MGRNTLRKSINNSMSHKLIDDYIETLKNKEIMGNIDFTIEEDDLKCLFIACRYNKSFKDFKKECESGYTSYYNRNINNLQKYGKPISYFNWINGQTISLT